MRWKASEVSPFTSTRTCSFFPVAAGERGAAGVTGRRRIMEMSDPTLDSDRATVPTFRSSRRTVTRSAIRITSVRKWEM